MIARSITGLLLVLLLGVAGSLYFVAATGAGAAWLAAAIVERSAGAVRVDGVAGTLRDGLSLARLEVRSGAARVRAEALELRLRPAALLGGRVVIARLRLGVLDIDVADDPARPPEPFRMPTVATPVPVEIEDLAIDRLLIRAGDRPLDLRHLRFVGWLAGTRLTVGRLGAAWDSVGIGIEGRADLTAGLPLDARLAWRLAGTQVGGSGAVRGDLARLQVRQALRLPAAVALTGSVADVADDPRIEAVARWSSWPVDVPGLGALRITGGRLEARGTPSDWRAALDGTLQGEAIGSAALRARAHGDLRRLVFDEARIRGDAGDIAARGVLDVNPWSGLRLDVRAARLDPALARPGLEGDVAGRVEVVADFDGDTLLRVRELSGTLMQRPLRATGEVRFGKAGVVFTGVDAQAGANRLRADGVVGERLSGRFELEAPQPGILWPGLSGSLSARARLEGTRERPVLDLQAKGRALVLAGNRVERLDLRLAVDRRQRADAGLSAAGLAVGDTLLGDLEATLAGRVQDHRLQFTLAGPLADVQLTSSGRWTGERLEHRLESASIDNEDAGRWDLVGEPQVVLAADAASVGAHCWIQDPTQLCIDTVAWSAERTRIMAALTGLDLQRFNRWLGEDLAIAGTAGATLDIDIGAQGPSGSATWRQQGTTIYYTGGDEPLEMPIERAEAGVTFAPEASTASLLIAGAGGLRLEGQGALSGPPAADVPLGARLAGQLPDIAPLLPLVAGDLDIAGFAGRISVDATVTGTLRSPRLAGEVRLAGGSGALAALGVTLQDIDVALVGDATEAFRLRGTARAGGALALSGEVRPFEARGPQAWINVRGERLDAVRLPDRYIQASPDITLRYAGGDIAVEGEVKIPKADIVIRQLPETAVSSSPDTVLVDREAFAPPPVQQRVGGEVALTLGRDVRLKAFGLDTLLEGTVKLSQGADGDPQGFGVLRLQEGKFGAYGKELTIERGTLGFAGPLDDPAINLQASRRVEWEGKSVTAGIRVSGTVQRAESRVYSSPAMSEADALSYLMSGRPMQSANANERSAITGAALSLGVSQTSPLTQALGSAVTLDELGFQGGTIDETEVVAGKQLNEDLYVRFAYGLFSRIGTLLARYRIGRNLSIEAASGEDQSLDLVYSIERD